MRTKMVSVWLSPEETGAVDAAASMYGVNRSDIIRAAIGCYLERLLVHGMEMPGARWGRECAAELAMIEANSAKEVR